MKPFRKGLIFLLTSVVLSNISTQVSAVTSLSFDGRWYSAIEGLTLDFDKKGEVKITAPIEFGSNRVVKYIRVGSTLDIKDLRSYAAIGPNGDLSLTIGYWPINFRRINKFTAEEYNFFAKREVRKASISRYAEDVYINALSYLVNDPKTSFVPADCSNGYIAGPFIMRAITRTKLTCKVTGDHLDLKVIVTSEDGDSVTLP